MQLHDLSSGDLHSDLQAISARRGARTTPYDWKDLNVQIIPTGAWHPSSHDPKHAGSDESANGHDRYKVSSTDLDLPKASWFSWFPRFMSRQEDSSTKT